MFCFKSKVFQNWMRTRKKITNNYKIESFRVNRSNLLKVHARTDHDLPSLVIFYVMKQIGNGARTGRLPVDTEWLHYKVFFFIWLLGWIGSLWFLFSSEIISKFGRARGLETEHLFYEALWGFTENMYMHDQSPPHFMKWRRRVIEFAFICPSVHSHPMSILIGIIILHNWFFHWYRFGGGVDR